MLIDSLLQELPNAKEDIRKVNLLKNLSGEYSSINTDKGVQYGQQAFDLAKKLDYKTGTSNAALNLGNNYRSKSEYKKALEYFFDALKIAEETGDKETIAFATNDIGIAYQFLSDLPKALEYDLKSLKISEEIANKSLIAKITNNLGIIYDYKSEFPEALEYYSKAIKISEDIGDKASIARIDANMARIYVRISDYPSAVEYSLRSLKIGEEVGDKQNVAYVTGNLGLIYKGQGEYEKALGYYLSSLKMNEEIGDKAAIGWVLRAIGNIYYEQDDCTKALEYDLKALKLSEETGDKRYTSINTESIGFVYSKQGKYVLAIDYYQKALTIAKEINYKSEIGSNLVNIGAAYLSIAKDTASPETHDSLLPANKSATLQKAIDFLNQGLAICTEIHELSLLQGCYGYLEDAYKIKGDYKRSLESADNYHTIKDTVFSKENDKKIMQQQFKYDYGKREDSLKLESEKKEIALQREIELKALKYEYDKKQAAAKSEKERQQLKYEQRLKEQQIEYDFAERTAKAEATQRQKEAERKQKEVLVKVEQEKKDALTAEQLKREKNIRYASIAGAGLLLIIAIIAVYAYRQKQKDNLVISKEKQRSEELLLNILPAEVADELKDKGSADAKYFDEVTVLFTDFVSFTKVSMTLTPQELVNELHACFKAFDHIMGKYNIEKIKTVGDAYLAVCGLPKASPDHAGNVVYAAKEIKEFMIKRKEELGERTFGIRVGVHSGSVVAGIVGVKKFAYDIWGDTVNTAARMEQNSEAGKINISETTYELVKDKFKCEYRGEIEAKNKGKLKMYYVS